MAASCLLYSCEPNSKAAESKLRGLTSLNQDEYDALLVQFDLLIRQKLSHYTLKEKKCSATLFQKPTLISHKALFIK